MLTATARRVRDLALLIKARVAFQMGPKTLAGAPPPVVIGGTGGSGTRAVAAVIRALGHFIGTNLNRSLDSLDLDRFFSAWLPAYLASGSEQSLSSQREAWDGALERALIWHRSRIGDVTSPWAVKHPRSVLMLPYLAAAIPGMKYIHVVRDGRDMAFSRNTQQWRHYAPLLMAGARADTPLPVELVRFWAHTNLAARRSGRQLLGDRYRWIRLEDLCADPMAVAGDLAKWLGASPAAVPRAAAEVRHPSSLGRWRRQARELVASLEGADGEALQTFGYLDGGDRAVGRPDEPR